MARTLRLLLREVGRGEQLAGELVGRADVDQVLRADRLDHVVAEGADRGVLRLGLVVGGGALGHVVAGDQLAGVQLPLLAAAVEELDVVVAVQLEVPVGVGREPVVVAAVEDHGVVVGDALGRQELLEALLVDEVTADRVLEVLGPVDPDRVLDVVLLVGGRVLVHLDDRDGRVVQVVLQPVGVDQDVAAAHDFSSGAVGGGACGERAGALGPCGGARVPGAGRGGRGGRGRRRRRPPQKVRQSMAATRHRSTARRLVRSACCFIGPDRRD